jgi:hypothetical protein
MPAVPAVSSRLVAASVFAAVTSLAASGWAGPEEDARADVLFHTAKFLQDKGQLAEACSLFAESKVLSPGVGITLHLADCYQRSGKITAAWSQFRQAEQMARVKGDVKRAELAHARAQLLEGQLYRLTVVASSPHDDWQVFVDGSRLPLDRLNAALAVDAGDHVVVVKAPGRPLRTLTARTDAANVAVTVQADERVPSTPFAPPAPVAPLTSAAVTAANPTPAAPATAPSTPVAPEPRVMEAPPSEPTPAPAEAGPSSRVDPRRWAEIGLLGVTAVGAGLGTFFLVRRHVLAGHDCSCDPSLESEASTAATLSFAAGGAALASSLVLYFTGRHQPSDTGWTVTPNPMASGAGALFRTSF